MIGNAEAKKCCGCGACASVCPQKCISFKSDGEGFLYPSVDEKICVGCDRCDRVCPFVGTPKKNGVPKTFAVFNPNESIRRSSSSGGVFDSLAKAVIANGGVVFGAAFVGSFDVRHISAETVEEAERLRLSKYVQSDTRGILEEVKSFLEQGRQVLFSGTPCQVSGIKKGLGKDFPNLLTVDLACHSVPSPEVWRKYLAYIEKKYSSAPVSVNFRNKASGWKKSSVEIVFENGKALRKNIYEDLYMKAFLRNLSLRPSCYDCPFKGIEREADLTLADFWGIENVCPEMDDDCGTSLVLVNSEKGRKVFDEISSSLRTVETDAKASVKYNSAVTSSVVCPENREEFFRILNAYGFGGKMKSFFADPYPLRIKKFLKRILRAVKGKH